MALNSNALLNIVKRALVTDICRVKFIIKAIAGSGHKVKVESRRPRAMSKDNDHETLTNCNNNND